MLHTRASGTGNSARSLVYADGVLLSNLLGNGAGGVAGLNPRNQPWTLIGSNTEYTTEQDHLKAKLAWDTTPQLRANLLLGWWHNCARGDSASSPPVRMTTNRICRAATPRWPKSSHWPAG